jgi:hypothetical protein
VHGGVIVLPMTRTRIALTLSTLGLAGLLGLTGCGLTSHQVANQASAAASDLSDEATAQQTVGLDTTTATGPSPAASAAAAGHRRAIRKYLRKNTLHGEVTVNGKDGVKTIVVQRGTVTAVTSTSVSVKSSDGFTATWTFGDNLKLVQDKKKVETSALKTGEAIGVAGTKDGGTDTARLAVIQ